MFQERRKLWRAKSSLGGWVGEEESTWDPETIGFSSGEAPAPLRNGLSSTWILDKRLDLCIFIGRRTLIIAVTPEAFGAERGGCMHSASAHPDRYRLVNARVVLSPPPQHLQPQAQTLLFLSGKHFFFFQISPRLLASCLIFQPTFYSP